MLGERGVEVEAVSSLYETEPVGEILDQPDFLNAAVRISTGLDPELQLPDGTRLDAALESLGEAERVERVGAFSA